MAVETSELAQNSSQPGRIEVISEAHTYRQDTRVSYFKDLAAADQGDNAARTRLERHDREMKDEYEKRERAARLAKPGEVEYRVNPSRTTGQGGYFAPPAWLIDQFATAPRPGRVLANELPNFALPSGVGQVNLPRLTTGLLTGTTADLGADVAQDAVDAATSCTVVTITGHGDVSMQALDQSPAGAHLDWAFFKDLTADYDFQLETQLINGSGNPPQLQGLLQAVPSSNKITTTQTTATTQFAAYGQVVAAIGNNRKLPPELWMLTTPRLAWIATQEDQQNRPLLITDKDGTGELDLISFRVQMNDAIPRNLGAGANQDVLIAIRPSDMMLFESAPRARVHLDVLSGTLQARIQLHHYVAVLWRYPTGIATLTGVGMAVPANF